MLEQLGELVIIQQCGARDRELNALAAG
eukprot:COSAG03_NODE_22682_length_288_cov_0.666667_1_plen_27_part_10